MTNNIDNALDEMEMYGGSFVKGLAGLYRLADSANKCLLERTFGAYFDEYGDIIKEKEERGAIYD